MTLLDELRNVEPGKPGQWSRRVSVTLACCLLILVTAVGLQVRVRGKLLPQLSGAAETLPDLEESLQEARRAQRRSQLLRMELQQLEEQLRQTGAKLPRGAGSLDLAVSLAAAWAGSPVEEVRPWEPPGEMSRRFPHLGAEMQLAGEYGQIIGTIGHVLTAGELRELVEFTIESGGSPDNRRLRANARLLAYFADERHAGRLPGIGAGEPAEAQAPPTPIVFSPPPGREGVLPSLPAPTTLINLPSPFAALSWEPGAAAATAGGLEREPLRESGFIRVSDRRYRIVDDPEGRPRLQPDTP